MKISAITFRKKSLVLIGFALLLVCVSSFVFKRLHFSHQDFPLLAKWQGQSINQSERPFRPQIIGHRGSGLKATTGNMTIGNTASAIRRGIDSGSDWIELDIRQSSDGYLVVFHDATIDLKTTGKGKVSELSLSELQNVEILVDPKEQIVTLDEVLSTVSSEKVGWVFDIKTPGIHKTLLQKLERKVRKDQGIIFGSYSILRDYKDCGYPLGYTLLGKNWENRFRVLFDSNSVMNRCRDLDCDYLVLPLIFTNQHLLDQTRSNGFTVWSYGSDNELDAKHSVSRGISGLIVDSPGLIANSL